MIIQELLYLLVITCIIDLLNCGMVTVLNLLSNELLIHRMIYQFLLGIERFRLQKPLLLQARIQPSQPASSQPSQQPASEPSGQPTKQPISSNPFSKPASPGSQVISQSNSCDRANKSLGAGASMATAPTALRTSDPCYPWNLTRFCDNLHKTMESRGPAKIEQSFWAVGH